MSNVKQNTEIAKLMKWYWDDDWGCLIPPEQLGKPEDMWTKWKIDTDGNLYRSPIRNNVVSGISYNGDLSKVVLPDYSGDISLTMQAVEYMRTEREFFITIVPQMDGYLISVSDFMPVGHYYAHLTSVNVSLFEELADAICHIILETTEAANEQRNEK